MRIKWEISSPIKCKQIMLKRSYHPNTPSMLNRNEKTTRSRLTCRWNLKIEDSKWSITSLSKSIQMLNNLLLQIITRRRQLLLPVIILQAHPVLLIPQLFLKTQSAKMFHISRKYSTPNSNKSNCCDTKPLRTNRRQPLASRIQNHPRKKGVRARKPNHASVQ